MFAAALLALLVRRSWRNAVFLALASPGAVLIVQIIKQAAGGDRVRCALGVLVAALLALIGLSRIYLGVHYPTDVPSAASRQLGTIARMEGSQHDPELPRGGYLVLGMIAAGHRTGYEISKMAEQTGRFFWAAGDGQVYPQLRKLSAAGLIGGRSERRGGRRKTIYDLTDRGREALQDWLTSTAPPMWELRDEGLLKLFLSDGLTVGQLRSLVATLRRTHERAVERLTSIEQVARSRPSALLTQRHGLRLHQTAVQWCDELDAELAGADPSAPAASVLEALLEPPA